MLSIRSLIRSAVLLCAIPAFSHTFSRPNMLAMEDGERQLSTTPSNARPL
jgi:hypothetical protein